MPHLGGSNEYQQHRFLWRNKENILKLSLNRHTVMTLSFRTDRSGQTVQTQITAQGLHYLLFHLHLFDKIFYGLASLFEFQVVYSNDFWHQKI